jgi:hypothetical protein
MSSLRGTRQGAKASPRYELRVALLATWTPDLQAGRKSPCRRQLHAAPAVNSMIKKWHPPPFGENETLSPFGKNQ